MVAEPCWAMEKRGLSPKRLMKRLPSLDQNGSTNRWALANHQRTKLEVSPLSTQRDPERYLRGESPYL